MERADAFYHNGYNYNVKGKLNTYNNTVTYSFNQKFFGEDD